MLSAMLSATIVKFGSQILVGAGILMFRYIEKSSVIKHYKKKINELLENSRESK
jgi:hypothetical protein